MSDPELTDLIRDSMRLVKRVAAGLASGTGYQPPEPAEEEAAP